MNQDITFIKEFGSVYYIGIRINTPVNYYANFLEGLDSNEAVRAGPKKNIGGPSLASPLPTCLLLEGCKKV